MTLRDALRDALARVIAAAWAIEDGDQNYARTLLLDLEVDLLGVLGRDELERAA